MQESNNTKAGINVVFSHRSGFEPYRFILEFVEARLRRAGVNAEFIDVEPNIDGGIRFSLKIDGKEY